MFAPQSVKSVLRQGEFYRKLQEDILSNPSHASASRISAMWKAHKAQAERLAETPSYDWPMHPDMRDMHTGERWGDQPDRNIELRRIRSFPPLTKPQQAD